MKTNLKIIFYVLFIFSSGGDIVSQTPLNDNTWQLVPAKSDEFNGTTLDLTKWGYLSGSHTASEPCSCELQFYQSQNVQFTGSSVKLKALKESPPIWGRITSDQTLSCNLVVCSSPTITNCKNFYYSSGGFRSKNGGTGGYLDLAYDYGYLEIEAKIPKGKGLWPAFWLHRNDPTDPCSTDNGHEIDIVEPDGQNSIEANSFNANVWWAENPDCNFNDGGALLTGFQDLSIDFHKYAVEWSPDQVFFYLDNTLIRQVTTDYVPDHPMDLYFNLAVSQFTPPDINTIFPNYFEINYFHFYKLNMDMCQSNVPLHIGSSGIISNSVYKDIIIDPGMTMESGNSLILRASNSYTFEGEFYVPIGAEFGALITFCY